MDYIIGRELVMLGDVRIRVVACLTVGLLLLTLPAGLSGQLDSDRLVQEYLDAGARLLREDASAADVDRLLELYHPDIVYEHPRVGARIAGREAVRGGMMSFLGQTRDPQVERVELWVGEGVIVVRSRTRFEAHGADGWEEVDRTSVQVLEIVDGRIKRLIDYW